MESKVYTREEIVDAYPRQYNTEALNCLLINLETSKKPTFVEQYVEHTASYCRGEMEGAVEFAEQQAPIIQRGDGV